MKTSCHKWYKRNEFLFLHSEKNKNKNIINQQPCNTLFHNEIIESLLYHHPDENKILGKIEYLIIKNRLPYNTNALYFKTLDNLYEDDISYRLCLFYTSYVFEWSHWYWERSIVDRSHLCFHIKVVLFVSFSKAHCIFWFQKKHSSFYFQSESLFKKSWYDNESIKQKE